METLDVKYKKAIDLHKDGYFHLALPVLVEYILSLEEFNYSSFDAFVLLIKICSKCQLDFCGFNALLNSINKRIPGKYLELAEFLKDFKDEIIKSKSPVCLESTKLINEFFKSTVAVSSSKIKALIKLQGRQNLRQDNHIYNEIIESDSKLRAVPISAQVLYKNSIEGNVVTALQHIPPGSVIYTEKSPIIFMINDKYKRNHCSFCCQKVGRDRVFCPKKCVDIVYCSDACRSLNVPCHDVLCNNLISSSGFYGLGIDQNSQLCAQFAAKFLSANEGYVDPLSFGGLPYLHYPCLENNFYETSLEHFEKLLTDFLVLKCCMEFEKKLTKSIDTLDFSWFLHLQFIIQANGMTLSTDHINEFGAALYLIASMVNHSCSSNSKFKILPGAQVAIVSREASSSIIQKTNIKSYPSKDTGNMDTNILYSINQGEEITISYHPVYEMPLLLRQKYLLDTYGFLCRCTRCESESHLASGKASLSQQEIDQYELKLQDAPRFFDLSTIFD